MWIPTIVFIFIIGFTAWLAYQIGKDNGYSKGRIDLEMELKERGRLPKNYNPDFDS